MDDPIKLFSLWFEEAKNNPAIPDPTVMTLATADNKGMPSARVVLLKGYDERGFVFYTNMESRKSVELAQNPYAALNIFWQPLGKQIRIEGTARKVTDAEADDYFNSRPLISRIGALLSKQSQPIDSYEGFMKKIEDAMQTYSDADPPKRPPYWSGWRVVPDTMEFWVEGKFRLHKRKLYTREGNGWKVERLYP